MPFFFASSADGTNVVKVCTSNTTTQQVHLFEYRIHHQLFSFILIQVFEEAVCAGLGHKKFGGKDFICQCLELFDDVANE